MERPSHMEKQLHNPFLLLLLLLCTNILGGQEGNTPHLWDMNKPWSSQSQKKFRSLVLERQPQRGWEGNWRIEVTASPVQTQLFQQLQLGPREATIPTKPTQEGEDPNLEAREDPQFPQNRKGQ